MKKRNTDFSSYNLQDLLENPDFVQWVLMPDDSLTGYWQSNQNTFPNLSKLIPEASKLVSSIKFKEEKMDDSEQQLLWQQIAAKSMNKKKTARILPLWLRNVAAAMFVGLLMVMAFYMYFNREISVTTTYGQIKTIMLPDHSEITLNANSQLKYARNWNKDKAREVWVSGEAFFKVNHLHQYGKIKTSDRFVVHAGKINVEVLGTAFNVNDRRGLINVALLNGKVSMAINGKSNAALMMQPGEVLEYQAVQDTIIRKNTRTANKIAWKNGLLVFEQITATELFNQLEDIYGYKVIIKNPEIKQKKLSGRFNSRNEDDLLKGISLAFGISIKKDVANRQLIVQ